MRISLHEFGLKPPCFFEFISSATNVTGQVLEVGGGLVMA